MSTVVSMTEVHLLAAEHGIRGDAMNGVRIEDETDPKTGVPVYSLYKAEDRGPSEQMLKDADVIKAATAILDRTGHGPTSTVTVQDSDDRLNQILRERQRMMGDREA